MLEIECKVGTKTAEEEEGGEDSFVGTKDFESSFIIKKR